MKIKVLGTGCPKCRALEANARRAVEELGVDAEVSKVTDISDIMEYDVMITPALVIDERVMASGRVADVQEIKGWIREAGK